MELDGLGGELLVEHQVIVVENDLDAGGRERREREQGQLELRAYPLDALVEGDQGDGLVVVLEADVLASLLVLDLREGLELGRGVEHRLGDGLQVGHVRRLRALPDADVQVVHHGVDLLRAVVLELLDLEDVQGVLEHLRRHFEQAVCFRIVQFSSTTDNSSA